MLSRFPGDLPWTLALAGGLSFAAMGFAGLSVELLWGRPSSTAAVGVVEIPVVSVAAALGGIVVGLLLRAAVSASGIARRQGNSVTLLSAAVIVAAVAAGGLRGGLGAMSDVRASEKQARPRVLLTSGQVERFPVSSGASHIAKAGSMLYGEDADPPARLPLPGSSNTLELSGLSASFGPASGKRTSVSLDPLDYVTRVDAVAMTAAGGNVWTVVAITGRATGQRLALVVLSPDGQVQHIELLERCWPLDQAPIEKWSLAEGKGGEVVVLPRACEGPLAFRVR